MTPIPITPGRLGSTSTTARTTWLPYTYSPQTTGAPANGQLRLDDVGLLALTIRISLRTADGFDAFYVLNDLPVGTSLFIQDKNDHTAALLFHTTGAPTVIDDYVEVAIEGDSGSNLANNQSAMLVIQTPEGDAPTPTPQPAPEPAPPPVADLGPDLVTVPEAATYLRVVLSTAQPDITADLTRLVGFASNAIRDYLKDRNDPAWTDTTAPPRVRDAVLLFVGNRWEHKGDDGAPNDTDAAVWDAIDRVLKRSRDPAYA